MRKRITITKCSFAFTSEVEVEIYELTVLLKLTRVVVADVAVRHIMMRVPGVISVTISARVHLSISGNRNHLFGKLLIIYIKSECVAVPNK